MFSILHHTLIKSYLKCKNLYVRDTTPFETEAFLYELQRNTETLQMQDVNTTFSKLALSKSTPYADGTNSCILKPPLSMLQVQRVAI